MFQKIKNFFQSAPAERNLMIEATLWLALARLMLYIPFRHLSRYLGQPKVETPHSATDHTIPMQISHALQRVSRHVPWECKCLAQAMAGARMLKRRNIASTLYLGIAKKTHAELSAHAWLRSGDYYLTGAENREDYTVILTFAQ